MKNDAMLLWSRVDQLARQQQITLKKLCEDNGLVYGTIMQNKARKIFPSLLLAKGLASALHVSLDYLVTGEQITDPVLKSIDNNPAVKEIAHKLTMCDESKLVIVNAMLDSWVPDEARSKGLA